MRFEEESSQHELQAVHFIGEPHHLHNTTEYLTTSLETSLQLKSQNGCLRLHMFPPFKMKISFQDVGVKQPP